ncbi:class I SAM-dependent methyltransferase, partial [Candidatus Micrarchaeota archaeon]|nr:class I SAM-dependent methyltransferase [Candidatus Micrarchaeota archaeon]
MAGFKGRFRVYNDFLNPEKSDVILSVGCKGGFFETRIVDKVGRIYAIDIDKNEIEKNRQKEPRIIFGHCDITKGTDFPGGHFDKVIFSEVIEHLPEGTELEALKEINRVLKKDGTLLFSTPNDCFVSKVSDPIWWVKNHRHYKIEKTRYLLENSGFKIER